MNYYTKFLGTIFVWLISLLFFSPVLWLFLSAFKTRNAILSIPPHWLFTPTLKTLKQVFSKNNGAIIHLLFNSALISLCSVILAVVVAYLAAYSFSRYRLAGTDFIMFLLLSLRMVPAAAVVIPIFLMYRTLGWSNSLFWIIMFYTMFSIPYSLWILKGFLDGVSLRYDESAYLDGASRLHIMFRIILPQVFPGIIASLIFNMIFVWNSFLFTYILGGDHIATVPVALAKGLHTSNGIDWQFLASLSLIYNLPLVIAVFFIQKYLLVGMTFGTVRGEV